LAETRFFVSCKSRVDVAQRIRTSYLRLIILAEGNKNGDTKKYSQEFKVDIGGDAPQLMLASPTPYAGTALSIVKQCGAFLNVLGRRCRRQKLHRVGPLWP